MKWRSVGFSEMMAHALNRQLAKKHNGDPPGMEGGDHEEVTWFSDGTCVTVTYREGFAYSEVTWESAQLIFGIYA